MPTFKTVDPKTANEWLANHTAIIIDVREQGEYDAMHIAGATLIPVGTIDTNKLPDLANKKLIIHCQLGRRGGVACEKLITSNPTLEIYNLEGGIVAWRNAGLPVAKSEHTSLPIDRQVQLTVGSGVLLGTALGYLLHPGFLLLSAFFGAGLIFTGYTGNCALAILMSKMPWNQNKSSTPVCK